MAAPPIAGTGRTDKPAHTLRPCATSDGDAQSGAMAKCLNADDDVAGVLEGSASPEADHQSLVTGGFGVQQKERRTPARGK